MRNPFQQEILRDIPSKFVIKCGSAYVFNKEVSKQRQTYR